MKRVFSNKSMTRIIITTLVILMLTVFNLLAVADEKMDFVIGVGTPGSTGYVHFEACVYLANKYSPNLNCSTISTAGSAESVILLEEGTIQAGSGGSTEIVAANRGEKPFRNKIAIWQMLPWTWWGGLMTTLDQDLETWYDLEGKEVSQIKMGSGGQVVMEMVLGELGMLDKIKSHYLSWADSKNALVDGIIDAYPNVVIAGKISPLMAELAMQKPNLKVLKIDEDALISLSKKNLGVTYKTIVPEEFFGEEKYDFLDKEITLPIWLGVGMTTPDVSEEIIYEFVKAVLEHTDELHEISNVSHACTLEFAANNFMQGIPVHPGAAKYFKERGLWDEDLIIGER